MQNLPHRRPDLPARAMRPLRATRGPDSLIVDGAADPAAMGTIVEILCGVDRPESILTWKRSPTVQALLTGLCLR